MRKDLIIGIIVSAVLHATFLFAFNGKGKVKAVASDDQKRVIQIIFEDPKTKDVELVGINDIAVRDN